MTAKEAFEWVKRVGLALGSWAWLLKIIVSALGAFMLFVGWQGYSEVKSTLAKLTEANTALRGEVVQRDTAAKEIRVEVARLLDANVDLRERVEALREKVGSIRPVTVIRADTGAVTAHGEPPSLSSAPTPPSTVTAPTLDLRPPALLHEGDTGRITVEAIAFETKAGNHVLELKAQCWREAPLPRSVILSGLAEADVSKFMSVEPPKEPGVGIGGLVSFGKHGMIYGPVVSPTAFNLWKFNFEVLGAIQANAAGDWQASAGMVGRFR